MVNKQRWHSEAIATSRTQFFPITVTEDTIHINLKILKLLPHFLLGTRSIHIRERCLTLGSYWCIVAACTGQLYGFIIVLGSIHSHFVHSFSNSTVDHFDINWTAKETCHLSKATHKNSTDENIHYLYTVVLQYPLLITCPKASDCLYNKEIDMNLNLVTVTVWALQLLFRNQQALQEEWKGQRQMSFPEHVSEIPEMCPDTRGGHIIEK